MLRKNKVETYFRNVGNTGECSIRTRMKFIVLEIFRMNLKSKRLCSLLSIKARVRRNRRNTSNS